MAATSTTISPSLGSMKPHLGSMKPHLKWNPLFHLSKSPSLKFLLNLSTKCSYTIITHNNSPKLKILPKNGLKSTQVPLTKALINKISKALIKALRKPAMVALLTGLLAIMYGPYRALAASGGRVGGSDFSSSRRESSPSYSYSSSSSPSYSYSYPSSSSSSSSYRTYVHDVNTKDKDVENMEIFLCSLCLVLILIVLMVVAVLDSMEGVVRHTQKTTTVVKLQVGLLGTARSLQMDLNRIAEVADTSSPKGFHSVLTDTILALMGHPDFCISAYSSVDVKQSLDEGERRFNQLSVEERAKFDEETLVNVNNIKSKTETVQRATGFSNEYIVVTILVAAEGVQKLPSINGSGDLKDALQKLADIPSSRTLAVEVLWTPQSENDTLSEQELLKDYPMLRRF